MSTKNSGVIKTLLSALFWIMLWQGLALLIGKPLLFPTPVSVILRLTELVCTIEFWNYTLISLLRISAGILAAMLTGVILAVLTCRFSVLDTLFSPIITIVKTTPVASFVVLVLIWIKRDYVPVLISALMVLPVVWANVSAGIRNTDKQLLEMAQVYKLPALKKNKLHIYSLVQAIFSLGLHRRAWLRLESRYCRRGPHRTKGVDRPHDLRVQALSANDRPFRLDGSGYYTQPLS